MVPERFIGQNGLAALGNTVDIIRSDFSDEADGTDGWFNGGNTISRVPSGGNPGGFLRADEDATFVGNFISAPPKFLEDISAYNGGSLAFDLRRYSSEFVPVNERQALLVGQVEIGSSVGSATSQSFFPNYGWTHHSVPLNAESFGV